MWANGLFQILCLRKTMIKNGKGSQPGERLPCRSGARTPSIKTRSYTTHLDVFHPFPYFMARSPPTRAACTTTHFSSSSSPYRRSILMSHASQQQRARTLPSLRPQPPPHVVLTFAKPLVIMMRGHKGATAGDHSAERGTWALVLQPLSTCVGAGA